MKKIPKKDKIANLNLIHEMIVSSNAKLNSDYHRLLSHALSTFLIYFDDDESDVYFVAEENLNKTIKCLLDSHLGRLQIEFYRFIRRNESEKCLRAALVRFADLCYLIRPQKSMFSLIV